jgi:hypothetical protein
MTMWPTMRRNIAPPLNPSRRSPLQRQRSPRLLSNPRSKALKQVLIPTLINTQGIVEASMKLSGANLVKEYIVHLQELLKNSQLVDKMFAFCLINHDGDGKTIHQTPGVPTNTTMLGAHFKILSNGKDPFEKLKQWEKAKKDKEEFRDPIVYFLLAMATDKDHEDLLSRIIHE